MRPSKIHWTSFSGHSIFWPHVVEFHNFKMFRLKSISELNLKTEIQKENTSMQILFQFQVMIYLERLEQNHILEENNSYMTYGFYAVPLQEIDWIEVNTTLRKFHGSEEFRKFYRNSSLKRKENSFCVFISETKKGTVSVTLSEHGCGKNKLIRCLLLEIKIN